MSGYTTTPNYGFIKPISNADDDLWGGHWNQNADSLDSLIRTVQTSVPAASTTLPTMNGAAAIGTGVTWARSDHVHASDTTKYNASNPSGYQTAAQVLAVVPAASTTAPLMDSTAAVGTSATYARSDHVHASDSSRATVASVPLASSTNPNMDGTVSIGVGTTWARADHVHPVDTSRAAQSSLASYLPLSGGTLSGALAASQGITYGDGHTFKFTWNNSQVVASVDGSGSPGALFPASGGTINGGLTVTAGLTSTGGNTFCNAIYFGYPAHGDSAMYYVSSTVVFQWQAGYSFNWSAVNGQTVIYGNSAAHTLYDYQGSYTLQGVGGNLTLTVGGAWKPGGGTWGATSDERVKRKIVPYRSGLAEVVQLRPIGFEYNGLGDTPDDGKTYYGLSAQATREVMPELVHEMPDPVGIDGERSRPALLDKQLGTELGPLLLALVNSVQELATRVETLESR